MVHSHQCTSTTDTNKSFSISSTSYKQSSTTTSNPTTTQRKKKKPKPSHYVKDGYSVYQAPKVTYLQVGAACRELKPLSLYREHKVSPLSLDDIDAILARPSIQQHAEKQRDPTPVPEVVIAEHTVSVIDEEFLDIDDLPQIPVDESTTATSTIQQPLLSIVELEKPLTDVAISTNLPILNDDTICSLAQSVIRTLQESDNLFPEVDFDMVTNVEDLLEDCNPFLIQAASWPDWEKLLLTNVDGVKDMPYSFCPRVSYDIVNRTEELDHIAAANCEWDQLVRVMLRSGRARYK